MPTVDLTDRELATATQCFRRLVDVAIEDSKRQTNPDIKLTFMRIAQGHQDTVEKLERARIGTSHLQNSDCGIQRI